MKHNKRRLRLGLRRREVPYVVIPITYTSGAIEWWRRSTLRLQRILLHQAGCLCARCRGDRWNKGEIV